MLHWPSQSLDKNPIENLKTFDWALVILYIKIGKVFTFYKPFFFSDIGKCVSTKYLLGWSKNGIHFNFDNFSSSVKHFWVILTNALFFSFAQTLHEAGTSFTPYLGSSTSLGSSSSWLPTNTTPLTCSSPSISLPDSSCTTTLWPTPGRTSRVGEPASGSPCSPSSSATSTDPSPTSTAGPSPDPPWWSGWLDD